ncbi:MAG: valine--tRNA ligase [Deltaproteobacteria bacterium]|nr:valine--tRNA ligase [Deltaproteobacteria bacterium]
MSQTELSKTYEPAEAEARWYAFWEREGLFSGDPEPGKPPYSIVIPPPNVTGKLHMGHALNVTLQDILCRYRRQKGDNVLWVPGTDHAGIATQNVVEKQLAAEGKSRHELGREAFIKRVWEWREEYGGAIIHQLKRLGASCDWSRERFTMDEGLSRAVRKVFVELYHQGLIYKGDYIINWCPRCRTALADLEVEHEDREGGLYHILYPWADGDGGVVVATTRPETMLGDTAVAVHPEDERYPDHGRKVVLPLMNREIPLITDTYVDREFGTGALKITPAHDPNDFEIGRRHNLPSVKVIADDGTMNEQAGPYAGLDRFAARKRIVEDLKAKGLLKSVEPYTHAVGHCYRCKTVVEPNLSKQWFVKTKPLAEKAMDAVKREKTVFVPGHWTKTYYEWMENIRDWCISRQIWWGHRVPAWTCPSCGELIVSMEDPDACPTCGDANLEQETDVLDTWFSSALWPFSTLGWPERTPELSRFYPTSVLVTAFDILFFWVARMMMMGIHFMEDVPFKDVYIHALVRDAEGKKMSKSKGNVIDPLSVMDDLGTDAFRFTLAAFAAQGRDIKLSVERVEGYRHFINKLWNAARFTLGHVSGMKGDPAAAAPAPASLPDRWILSRVDEVAKTVERELEAYRFNEAAGALYQFVWHEFCDWYLEAIKPVLYKEAGDPERAATLGVLRRTFHDILVLLHPFIPFVTEELYHRLPGTSGSIMRASFPALALPRDREAEQGMALVMELVTAIRNVRSEMNIPPAKTLSVVIHPADEGAVEALSQNSRLVENLARLDSLSVSMEAARPKGAATALVQGHTVYVLLEGVMDWDRELARIDKDIAKVEAEMGKLDKKLANPGFVQKAPPEVVEKVKAQREELAEKQERLKTNIARVREFHAQ